MSDAPLTAPVLDGVEEDSVDSDVSERRENLRALEVALVLKDGIGFSGIIEKELRKFFLQAIDRRLLDTIEDRVEVALKYKGVDAQAVARVSPESTHGLEVTVTLR